MKGEDGLHRDADDSRGGKKCCEQQPQEQPGCQPMNPLAFTWFPQAKSIFETRAPEGQASLPFLAWARLGVLPCTSIHVLRTLCLIVILSLLYMPSQAEGRPMGKAAAGSAGMFPGTGLLSSDASPSRLTWLLYFRSGKGPNLPIFLILTYPFRAPFQSLLTSFFSQPAPASLL